MKYTLSGLGAEEQRAVAEVAPLLRIEIGEGGTPVTFIRGGEGLTVTRRDVTRPSDGHKTVISRTVVYSSRSALLRAVGLLAENDRLGRGDYEVNETPAFHTLGAMLDNSRNAVMTNDSVKKMCRILAVMGYNTLMLYTEDTYEMEGEPYFGYLRGRFTAADLKELDAYAALLGIELVPCIQTLAHLERMLRWPAYDGLRDCDNILTVGDERTYALIDKMLATMSGNLRSRRINIGMDEAGMLGRGQYLRKNGYRDSKDIMLEHLNRVVELCRKYDYQPIMWSDLFFSMSSPTEAYYDMELEIPDRVIEMVPPEVTLAYWDYYHIDRKIYDHMIDQHHRFHNPVLFAGGAWRWGGLTPINRFGQRVVRTAIPALREKGMDQVIVTAWGDNGSECSFFAVLPTLQTYAEGCWSGDTGDGQVSRRLKTCADADLAGFLDLDLPNYPPDRSDVDSESINCSRYLLYQDPLLGLFDRHVGEGITDKCYAGYVPVLERRKEENPAWAYLFETQKALCHVLALKSELGIRLKKAYDTRDRAALSALADKDIPELLTRLDALTEAQRTQWLTENKAFGLDVQDLRYGGLHARLEQAARRVCEYLDGKTDRIEELEAERLYYDGRSEDSDWPTVIQRNVWSDMVTVNTL
ncbi:MAG: beta-N-acetylhexosaminidase [Clostridiales bacterium]|nr:beta-N-acetylhexosaminidase [Clostridiales bacterium]